MCRKRALSKPSARLLCSCEVKRSTERRSQGLAPRPCRHHKAADTPPCSAERVCARQGTPPARSVRAAGRRAPSTRRTLGATLTDERTARPPCRAPPALHPIEEGPGSLPIPKAFPRGRRSHVTTSSSSGTWRTSTKHNPEFRTTFISLCAGKLCASFYAVNLTLRGGTRAKSSRQAQKHPPAGDPCIWTKRKTETEKPNQTITIKK